MKYLILVFLIASCAKAPVKVSGKYTQTDWLRWSDFDKDCQNTRHEILIARSLSDVELDGAKCKVLKGSWEDYYYPQIVDDVPTVYVDHLIPLDYAFLNGASKWTQKEREAFANDPDNLVLTSGKFSKEKGTKTVANWLPPHKEYACKYLTDWLKVKKKYKLVITKQDQKAIQRSKCNVALK